MTPPKDLDELVELMRLLLGPNGCPWDREQTLETLKPFLVEEAYEVLDAIDEGDPAHHCEELGDLLLQIVFQAELAHLSMSQVIAAIGQKLIRRHPHVFGTAEVRDAEEVVVNWERIKQGERGKPGGLLQGVPRSMPALRRAQRLTAKAAKVGFDWPDADAVRAKVLEELHEFEAAIASADLCELNHELGDLLFAIVNWARKHGLDAEEQLQAANQRFMTRFAHIEARLAERGKSPAESTLAEMDELWEEAKQRERQG